MKPGLNLIKSLTWAVHEKSIRKMRRAEVDGGGNDVHEANFMELTLVDHRRKTRST